MVRNGDFICPHAQRWAHTGTLSVGLLFHLSQTPGGFRCISMFTFRVSLSLS